MQYFLSVCGSLFVPAAGAIVVEWNVHDPAGQQGAAGTWDTHIMWVLFGCLYPSVTKFSYTFHFLASEAVSDLV